MFCNKIEQCSQVTDFNVYRRDYWITDLGLGCNHNWFTTWAVFITVGFSFQYINQAIYAVIKHCTLCSPFRTRQGRNGGVWRHVKEVMQGKGQRIVFVDGITSIDDLSRVKTHMIQGGVHTPSLYKKPAPQDSKSTSHIMYAVAVYQLGEIILASASTCNSCTLFMLIHINTCRLCSLHVFTCIYMSSQRKVQGKRTCRIEKHIANSFQHGRTRSAVN